MKPSGRCFVILLAVFCLGWANQGFPENRIVKMGYIEFPPVFFTNDRGKPEGFLIDLAEMVLSKAGYELSARALPTKRMAKELAAGKIHLWIGLATLPQFEGTTYIGRSEVARNRLRAYYAGATRSIRNKTDLSGRSVLIMRGYSYGGWIHFIKDPANNVRYIETDGHIEGFRMLKAGRAEYFLNYRSPAETALKSLSFSDLSFSEISSFGTYFVVSKKAPGAKTLLRNMESAYRALVQSGRWNPPE
jgi:polar amino acid transport system substrate-binding protein